MIRKFDWLIFKRFVGTFIFMVLILAVIVLVIDFAEKLDDFIDRKAPTGAVIWDYYARLLPFYINLLSPICIFLAVIFFTARMTQLNENTAIFSAGVSFYRFMAPFMVTAAILGGSSFYLNAYLVPRATRVRMEFEYKYLKSQVTYSGRNLHYKVGPGTHLYLLVYSQTEREATQPSLEYYDGVRLTGKWTADKMVYDPVRVRWTLYNVRMRRLDSTGEHVSFRAKLDTVLRIKPEDMLRRDNYAESMPLDELYDAIELERMRGSDYLNELILEKNERIAYPFASLILTLMGVALSTRKRRGGIALQLGLGLILSFIYVLVLVTAKAAFGDLLPLWLSVWVPNIVFAVLAVILVRVAPK
jgi:lipopolysaccharide export system permease protein